MGIFDDNRDEESQKLWNLLVFKVYATDKEMDEMFPVLVGIGAIGLVVWFLWWAFT